MKNEWFFEIPGNIDVMVKLVQSIPDNWSSHVDGYLNPPDYLIEFGGVEIEVGFSTGELYDINSTNVDNLITIIGKKKFPGFVEFVEESYHNPAITLEVSKKIATHFLKNHYLGYLYFYREDRGANLTRCEMNLQPWEGVSPSREGVGIRPPRVKVVWDGSKNSYSEVISLTDKYRSMKLHEYNPMTCQC